MRVSVRIVNDVMPGLGRINEIKYEIIILRPIVPAVFYINSKYKHDCGVCQHSLFQKGQQSLRAPKQEVLTER